MPQSLTIRYQNNKGSILVAVVAFITVMTIAMGGFLGVAKNVVSQETMELNDDRAFLAAESGLLIGTNWLRESNNWLNYRNTGYHGNVYSGIINGYSITVTVSKEPSGELRIRSITSGGQLPYAKSLSWTVTEAHWNDPGVFINDIAGGGGIAGGGLNNEWFDGPVHTNTPILVSSVSVGKEASVRFVNGKVTTYNLTALIPFAAGGHWGNYGTSPISGNNYDFGIWKNDAAVGDYGKLDELFQLSGQYSEFYHTKDSIFMPRITTQTRTLPPNLSPTRTAILQFEVQGGTTGRANYYYYDAADNQQVVSFNNPGEIIRIPNDVQVLGTVMGQTTVITDPGFSIYPVGDITYHGFVPDFADMDAYSNGDNYGLGGLTPLNNDVLALVSGADIVFGLDKHIFSLIGGEATLSAVPSNGTNKPEFLITAQLIATESTCGIRYVSEKINQYNYDLKCLGTRAIDTYQAACNATGVPGNMAFRYYYDIRFMDGLRAPGMPSLQAYNNSGAMFILNTDWTEENIIL
ncbi:MAG: hypothetical protein JW768_00140 [Chitinispirillaceae bacterium]|nr:hypothetical protein [Chitinispirillaceae bacterium]